MKEMIRVWAILLLCAGLLVTMSACDDDDNDDNGSTNGEQSDDDNDQDGSDGDSNQDDSNGDSNGDNGNGDNETDNGSNGDDANNGSEISGLITEAVRERLTSSAKDLAVRRGVAENTIIRGDADDTATQEAATDVQVALLQAVSQAQTQAFTTRPSPADRHSRRERASQAQAFTTRPSSVQIQAVFERSVSWKSDDGTVSVTGDIQFESPDEDTYPITYTYDNRVLFDNHPYNNATIFGEVVYDGNFESTGSQSFTYDLTMDGGTVINYTGSNAYEIEFLHSLEYTMENGTVTQCSARYSLNGETWVQEDCTNLANSAR